MASVDKEGGEEVRLLLLLLLLLLPLLLVVAVVADLLHGWQLSWAPTASQPRHPTSLS
jgi:hypothetical protein